MLLFRSEEHVDRWLRSKRLKKGALLSLEQQWQLASTWYRGRLAREWRRRTPEEAQRIFEDVGLQGDFWRLHP